MSSMFWFAFSFNFHVDIDSLYRLPFSMFAGIIITYSLWFVQSLVPISFRWICTFLSYCLRSKTKSLRYYRSYLGLFSGPIPFPLHGLPTHEKKLPLTQSVYTFVSALLLSHPVYMGSFSAPATSLHSCHLTAMRTSNTELVRFGSGFGFLRHCRHHVHPSHRHFIASSWAHPLICIIFHANINWRGCFRTCCSNWGQLGHVSG